MGTYFATDKQLLNAPTVSGYNISSGYKDLEYTYIVLVIYNLVE